MEYDILVNKDNHLGKDYIPERLVKVTEYNAPKIDSRFETLVEETAFLAFYEMQASAFDKGYHIIIDSGYRPYEYQEIILAYNLNKMGDKAYNTVALPGTSEHQTGLAIDFALMVDGKYTDEFDDSFEEVKWVHENAHKYGFILRYPKEKENVTGYNYECWHLRYVGREISYYMHDNDISTLEEYKKGRKLSL